jgi:uncharacterized protein YndB with AHSA1/START domain
MLSQFMTPGPGMTVPAAETNPVVGGKFRIVMRAGDKDLPHEGEYRVIDRPSRLVFTWNSEPAGRDSVVSIMFTRVADRETKVSLTHERLPNQTSRDNHQKGWGSILDVLAQRAASMSRSKATSR